MKTCNTIRTLCVGLLATPLLAQSMVWKKVPTPKMNPLVNSRASMTYDAARRQVVLFDNGGKTWLRDDAGWRQANPAASPSSRNFAAMAYDAARENVVLFGGRTGTNTQLSDTWLWNGSTWKQIATTSAPSAMSRHVMAFDAARKQVVLFHGGQTWLWNGQTWKAANPTTSPPAGVRGAMAYDPSQKLVLLKGEGLLTDLWLWNGSDWRRVSTATTVGAPEPRMAYDEARREMLLWHAPALYAWDGSDWVKRSSGALRVTASVTYDAARQELVLCGFDFTTRQNDCLTYGPVGFRAYGAGCGSTQAVTISPRSNPKVGGSVQLESWNLAASAQKGVLALGTKPTRVDLSGAGMPNCWLLQSNEFFTPFSIKNGGGTASLAIPNNAPITCSWKTRRIDVS